VEIESELSRLRMEEISMRLQYGPDHPQMRALQTRRDSLDAARTELEKEVAALPERQQDLLRLRREIEVNTQLYTSLLNSAQELRVAQAGTVGNVRVVDPAAVGYSPVRPRKQRILMISLVLGALLGTVAVFGREMLRRGMTDPDSSSRTSGSRCMPWCRTAARRSAVRSRPGARTRRSRSWRGRRPTDSAVESLRSLRTALSFALMDADRNVVVITSPGPSSGKTFLSVNLAWVLGQNKQKVLLVDADLRRGHVNAYLEGRRRTPGLSEVLSGQSWLEDAVVPLVPGRGERAAERRVSAQPVRAAHAAGVRRAAEEAAVALRRGADRYAAGAGGDRRRDRCPARGPAVHGGARRPDHRARDARRAAPPRAGRDQDDRGAVQRSRGEVTAATATGPTSTTLQYTRRSRGKGRRPRTYRRNAACDAP
jgi:hypothetical protein